ncbi:heme/hemin ABC transporter substrate-binding protein [Falsiroseomonas tokyonensis]|uniref:Hemin ABC transporter substrate-binding protein n=1 Tax=Falsiroseomonas tokyonensis TaxID=430521 RepID=A0ABV7BS24_9PROT|nr:ABC transporter substrate-binding protein [Falsiroseomonas tokyonensis]MBU8537628.1 ABC transporter substrate-binding protein [Falsiroseomonas tokyonensis]
MRRRALLGLAATLPLAARAAERRLVTVGGAVTETVFALGAGSQVAAVDSTSLFPAPVRALPQVGYLRSLAPEGLISLNPDLLLLSDEAGPPQAIAVLRAAGAPVALIPDGAGAAAVPRKILAIAQALGLEGRPLAEAVADDWARLDAPVAALRPVRAIFVLSAARGAPLVSGRGTHADALLGAVGAENVLRDFTGYRPLSAEAAALLAPEAIVMMQHALAEAGGVDAVLRTTALAVTPAAAARRVMAVDGAYALGFGPRAAHARRDLAALLHPRANLPSLPARPWV